MALGHINNTTSKTVTINSFITMNKNTSFENQHNKFFLRLTKVHNNIWMLTN